MRLANKAAFASLGFSWALAVGAQTPACAKPLYLTFDTGHMGVAPWIAQVLQRQKLPVTFFVANEKTIEGDGSLGDTWSAWWSERALEGHEFASHSFDHVYWQADEVPASIDAPTRFKVRPSAGPRAGQRMTWSAAEYCDNLKQASSRIEALTGRPSLPLFRAPGGKTSARLLAAAKACGYAHVGWASAGFLGDELPSESYSNQHLLNQTCITCIVKTTQASTTTPYVCQVCRCPTANISTNGSTCEDCAKHGIKWYPARQTSYSKVVMDKVKTVALLYTIICIIQHGIRKIYTPHHLIENINV
jgi:peptidoglycan/xylan/chitin deacetylase (PgdA/CDA1 family)